MTRPPVAVLLLFLLTRAAIIFVATTATDTVIYHLYAEAAKAWSVAGLFQAHDVEYPQSAIIFMAGVAHLADTLPHGVEKLLVLRSPAPPDVDAARYQVAFSVALFAIDLSILVLLSQATSSQSHQERIWSLNLYVLGTAALGPILYDRLDLIVGGVALCAALAIARGRKLSAYGILTVGAAFKLVPVLLMPIAVLTACRNSPRYLSVAAWETATAAAILAVWPILSYIYTGESRAFVYLNYHAERGLEIGSVYAVPVCLGFGAEVHQRNACYTVIGPVADRVAEASPISSLLGITAALLISIGAIRRSPAEVLSMIVSGCMLIWLAFIVTCKVGSPQYLLWLMPLLPLMPRRTERERQWAWGLVAAALVVTMTYPYMWWAVHGPYKVGRQDTWTGPNAFGYALLATRWGMLLGLTVWLGFRLRNEPVPSENLAEDGRIASSSSLC